MSVTWCSSWSSSAASDQVDVQLLPDARGGVASLSALPLHLSRPTSSADASVPCQMSIQWTQPLRCLQLQLEVLCSARHVELYAQGTRRNMLGEEEQGENYLGTFRGAKQGPEPQLFAMSAAFKQSDRDCDVLKSLQTLRVKFVSLTGDKSTLKLHEMRCIFVPMEPVATVDPSAAGLVATMSGLGLGGTQGIIPDVQMILQGFQQTLEREMETKIARAIDAKLSTLSQRLAFSEQALFQLHKKMDVKDAHVQASLSQIQQKFSQLEDQLSQFSIVNGVKNEDPDEEEVKSMEETNNVEADEAKVKKTDEVAESEVIAEGE